MADEYLKEQPKLEPREQQPVGEATPQGSDSPQPKSFQHRFAEFSGPIINCTIRGLMSVTLGAPFNVLIVGICSVFGQVISALTATGMLSDVLKLRGECREAFDKGLNACVPQAPPKMPPQNLQSKLMNGGVLR